MFLTKTRWRTFLVALPFWQPLTDFWAKTTSWPVIGKWVSYLINDEHYNVSFIPVNESIETDDSTVLPRAIVDEMIRIAACRVILPVCLCRIGCRCHDYPMEIGCIFLGESAKQIDPSIGKQVSAEEALAHVDKSVKEGLIPQIGRVDPDPFMLGIKPYDRDRFLTLCFCCSCCCIAMRNMPRWSKDMKNRMKRLEGLSVIVSEDCNSCGKCVKECFASAIELHGGKAIINDECKGCGICVNVCPVNAISLNIDNGNELVDAALRRIRSFADVE